MLDLGFWFVMQLLSGTLSLEAAGDAGGVAWWAHVGGFALGMALALIVRRLGPPREWRTEYVP